ncbi:MAG: CsbD family protein [Sciscionella sp.]
MGSFDKAKHQAEQVVGKGKEAVGDATDNEDLQAAGKRDQTTGEAKEAAQDVKDKAAGAFQDAKKKLADEK